jgi:hypothetical protein
VTPEFNVADVSTWRPILTAPEVAAILRRKVLGLKKAIQTNPAFVPAPFHKKPYLWRKSDLVRFVESGRGSQLRRVG